MVRKKWTRRKRNLVILSAVAVVVALAITASIVFKPDPLPELFYAEAYTGPITQTLNLSGTVESANRVNYEIYNGVKVKEVFVLVGDRIEKGDVLATFDAASLNSILAEKQQAYNAALKTYNEAQAAQKAEERKQQQQAEKKDPPKNDPPVETDPNLVEALGKLIGSSVTGLTQLIDLLENLTSGGNLMDALGLNLDLTSMLGGSTMSELTNLLQGSYKTAVDSTKADLDSTKAAIAGMKNGWIAKADGIVREVKIKAGETFVSSQAQSSGQLDMSSLMGLMSGDTSGVSDMLGQFLGGGGDTYGMAIEYYPFEVSFQVNKYDLLKVHLNQKAAVTTQTGKELEAYISFISPVADGGGDSISINSLLGGGASASGIRAKVTVPEPDESVIIGFDISVSIEIEHEEKATIAPVEAIQFSGSGSYVFVYNRDTKVVTRTEVTIGLTTDLERQVLTGCKVGDILIKSPPPNLKDGDRVNLKEASEK